ncbi:PREDICTED: uncharacterized protein LOC109583441 [Amphimedon queenslandica]|uniref:Death domain-containing protein n=2 Tax=Amphimedon queenslandica TaxID=400682 RepID=A0AAN0JC58_AMPQE|nr:PREDICTED: uncharacterized protein LOC109583441 [Amphimedon queenslandica]|eukprot:XP_019854352.1 PREDICTED: uncharacterized protein LOC109583441 [Amphimedon queenslandica]
MGPLTYIKTVTDQHRSTKLHNVFGKLTKLQLQANAVPIFPCVIFDTSTVSLTYESDDDVGWTRINGTFSGSTVSIEQIDYHKVMDGDIKNLKLSEKNLTYPPRIRVQFISSKIMPPKTVTVKFDGVKLFPGSLPVTDTIILRSDNVMESPISIASDIDSNDAFSKDNDPDLGDMLQIITIEKCVNDIWFNFGYHIGISVPVLNGIEAHCTTSDQCTRQVIFHWRSKNKTASWKPLAEALVKAGLPDVAHKLRDRFVLSKAEASSRETGRYCSLCKKIHFTIYDVPDEILNSPPKMKDLVDIIASKIEDKYFLFGTLIGLNLSVLRAIETERRTCKERFIEVLSRWINDDPNNVTWRTIIQILQADALQASAIADKAIEHLCNL